MNNFVRKSRITPSLLACAALLTVGMAVPQKAEAGVVVVPGPPPGVAMYGAPLPPLAPVLSTFYQPTIYTSVSPVAMPVQQVHAVQTISYQVSAPTVVTMPQQPVYQPAMPVYPQPVVMQQAFQPVQAYQPMVQPCPPGMVPANSQPMSQSYHPASAQAYPGMQQAAYDNRGGYATTAPAY